MGFYGAILIRDINLSKNNYKESRENYTITSFLKNIKAIVFEFGPAEILDTFFSRPFMMYIFPIFTGNIQIGIILGKIAADIICYITIIISYELQQKYKSKKIA